ncbi:uncharacterized protein LOC6585569 [Drosophila mojavensis]|uniref:Uncharacterized protein n=1 Tax=Drosophila mojavensis TaxID=7230 RepID=B4L6P3_DROMO|nr:uncharacterized protein LOC6585569 [Drosophila mojavensis]EDW06039.1 uncharacterized protein Dmoj_GI16405 [Drosophila mojavensis]
MFNKTFFVALILCACYLSATWARPQFADLPQLPVPGLDSLPIGNVGGAVGSALGAATGGLAAGGLTKSLSSKLGQPKIL